MKKLTEFDEFITGKMELNVGGKELFLDVTIKDKRKLKSSFGMGKNINEEILEKMDSVFIDILKRSYPKEKAEAMEGFYSKYDTEFLEKFMIAVGWAKQKDFEEAKHKLETQNLPPN